MTSVAPTAQHASSSSHSSSHSASVAAAAHAAAQQQAAAAAAAANLSAVLKAHLTQSSAHPALTTPVQACTRFSWTAGGAPGLTGLPVSMLASQPSTHGHAHGAGGVAAAAAVRAPGLRVVFQWPVVSLAREWKRWEALLNGADPTAAALDPPTLAAAAVPAAHGMPAPAVPGAAAAAAAASAAASAALPALPAPALSTGQRWSVVIENCFLLPRAGTPAASAALSGQRDRESKLYRVRMSHQSGAHASSWLVMHNAVVEGSSALDRWLDSAGGSGGADSSAVQLRSSQTLQGEEWHMGDFIIRLATCKAGHKHHNALVMEIEHSACTYPSLDNCRPLYELAASLGVPASAAQLRAVQDNAWPKFAEFGLSPTHYTAAHSALQYIFLTSNLKDNVVNNAPVHAPTHA